MHWHVYEALVIIFCLCIHAIVPVKMYTIDFFSIYGKFKPLNLKKSKHFRHQTRFNNIIVSRHNFVFLIARIFKDEMNVLIILHDLRQQYLRIKCERKARV